jgi:hypothetical protein
VTDERTRSDREGRAPVTHPPEPDPARRSYDAFADKVGMVPNFRAKDNLLQGLVVAVLTLVGAIVGFFVASEDTRSLGVALGTAAGLVGGGLLSGFVLMIVGLLRKA